MDAFGEGEHVGIAAQVVLELLKDAEGFLCLAEELAVFLESIEIHWIINVTNGYAGLLHSLTEEHVLIAVMPESLVKGIS